MKAIRKSDGKVIEVTPVIFGYSSDNAHYHPSELDFKVEEAEEVTIDGWVARDSNGTLWICSEEPQRYSDWWIIDTDEEYTKKELPSYLFPSLTWKSDPLEVTVTIKPKKKSSI